MKGFLVQAAWKHFCWNPPPPQPPPMDKTSGYLKAINVRLSPNYLSKAIQRNRQPLFIVLKGVVDLKPLQASWKKIWFFLEILKIVRNSGMRCNCGLVIYCHPSGQRGNTDLCIERVHKTAQYEKMDSINFVFRAFFPFPGMKQSDNYIFLMILAISRKMKEIMSFQCKY